MRLLAEKTIRGPYIKTSCFLPQAWIFTSKDQEYGKGPPIPTATTQSSPLK